MIFGMRTGYLCRLKWEKKVILLPLTYLPQALVERNHIHHVKNCHRRLDPWKNIKKIITEKRTVNVIIQASEKLYILHCMRISQTVIQKNAFPGCFLPAKKTVLGMETGWNRENKPWTYCVYLPYQSLWFLFYCWHLVKVLEPRNKVFSLI